jgi:hypothetical protein
MLVGKAAVMACQLFATVPLACVDDSNAVAMTTLSTDFYDAHFLLPALSLCTVAQVVKLHNIHRSVDAPFEPPAKQGIDSDRSWREMILTSWLGQVGFEEPNDLAATRSNLAGIAMKGRNLPLSRFERLFEEFDSDGSGTLNFDGFVEMVHRLSFKPDGLLRETAKDGVKDDVLCGLCYDLGCDDDELDELSCRGD